MTAQLSRTGQSLGIASTLALADGARVSTVQLLAMGTQPTRNGEPRQLVVADLAHAEAIVAASLARATGSDIVIDYDHQTVFAASNAGRAEAAGWVKRLYATAQGVMADVEWTASAASKLGERLYRYISPYFTFDKKSGRVSSIINAGLTNTPNLDLAAVASALSLASPGAGSGAGGASPSAGAGTSISTEEDDDSMTFKVIATALGLAADADEAAILAAIAASNKKGAAAAGALAATATALGVELGEDLTAVASAATSLKAAAGTGEPDPTKFVPISTVTELQTGLATANGRIDAMAATTRRSMIDAAVAEGRLTPAMVKHVEKITDETALASFIADLPATGLGKATVNGEPATDDNTLSAHERAVASAFGLTDEQMLAAKKKDAA